MSQNLLSVLHTDPNLPSNWKREVKEKPGKGKTTRHEIVIISPDGKVFKNQTQLDKYLRSIDSTYSSEDFDFTLYGRENSRSKKRKILHTDIHDANIIKEQSEDGGRRRSGRIQQKQRSLDDDSAKPEKSHFKAKDHSPSKTSSSTPNKKIKKSVVDVLDSSKIKSLKPDETVAQVHQETTTTTTIIGHDEVGKETAITSISVEKSDVDIVTNESANKTLEIIDNAIEQQNDIETVIEENIVKHAETPNKIMASLHSPSHPNDSLAVNLSDSELSCTKSTNVLDDHGDKFIDGSSHYHHHNKHNNHIENGDDRNSEALIINDSISVSQEQKDVIDHVDNEHHIQNLKHSTSNVISQNTIIMENTSV